MKLSPHEMAWLLRSVGFAGVDGPTGLDNVVLGVAIGLAESLGDTDALGITSSGANVGNRDHGVWQISGKFHADKIIKAGGDWRDPLVNARLTKAIFDEAVRAGRTSGWQPWATYKLNTEGKASYMEYLPAAKIAAAAPWKPILPEWAVAAEFDILAAGGVNISEAVRELGESSAAINAGVLSLATELDTLPTLEQTKAMIAGLTIRKTETINFGF